MPALQNKSTIVRLSHRLFGRRRPAPVAAEPFRPGVYPAHLEEIRRLPNGSAVLLRPIRAADAPGLRANFAKLSPEDVRHRFFMPMARMSRSMANRLCQIDYDRHMALVAINPAVKSGHDGWGVVRLVADREARRAEFAITVRSDLQHQGLGTLLAERLLAYGRSRGFTEIWGDVLAENRAVLGLARKFGFQVGPSPDEPGVLRVSKRLS